MYLSNVVLYDVLSQGASKLPQVIYLELEFYLILETFLELFTLSFGNFDASLGKTSYSASFERSQ